VGLLNVLEERDVQIRGYKIRLPLDVLLVASANPEDYTNRGRLITPLKDRFGSQIRTHYPLEAETEMAIVRLEARPSDIADVVVHWPLFMEEIVATVSHLARSSSHVNQRSGVSVRLSVSNFEILAANATRRALHMGETDVAPRVSDLAALAASMSGKIEIEAVEDGHEAVILENLLKASVLQVFKQNVASPRLSAIVDAFEQGLVAHAGEDIASEEYLALFEAVPPLRELVVELVGAEAPVSVVASATEFVLEGLHLGKRLNKDQSGTRATYRSR
jgi:magnesium chelatase subunit I